MIYPKLIFVKDVSQTKNTCWIAVYRCVGRTVSSLLVTEVCDLPRTWERFSPMLVRPQNCDRECQ